MRWKRTPYGEVQTRSCFAWFPIRVDREYRWLEEVTFTRRLDTTQSYNRNGKPVTKAYWLKLRFIDRSEGPNFFD